MNALQTLFHQPWVARLGWTMLHSLWQGALLAGLLAALRTSSAKMRYGLACGALAGMTAAPVLTFLWLSGASVPSAAALAQPAAPAGAGGSPSLLLPDAWDWISPRLGTAWLLGAALCSLRLFGGWLSNARLRRRQLRPAPAEWSAIVDRLMSAAGAVRRVQLRVSARIEVPVVVGWLRPMILVPAGAVTGMPAALLEGLLAHEVAHILRNDYLVNLLQSAAEAVLFYHPAVWWVSRRIRLEREHCCDDAAVQAMGGDALGYAHALAALESWRPAHRYAMAASGGSLRLRIRRLVAPRTDEPASGGAWVLGAALLLAIGSAAVYGFQAGATPAAAEPVVEQRAIWVDTVKQGDFAIEVRGLGTVTSAGSADIDVAKVQARNVVVGQSVLMAFLRRKETVTGRLQALVAGKNGNLVTANVALLAPLPGGVATGDPVDAVIKVGEVRNTVYVGRPVSGRSNGTDSLFKLDSDGHTARRVNVQFGQASVNVIEVKSGLQPGDRVILNDMSAYRNYNTITVK